MNNCMDLDSKLPSFNTNHLSSFANEREADNMRERRETFIGWRGRKNPVHLAIAGFCYSGTSDKVQCPTCNLRLYNWEESEDAVQAHKTHSPECPFIKKWYNVPAKTVSSDAAAKQGDASIQPPKYPEFIEYQRRLQSFFGWPIKREHQSPSSLATEGFFYIGSADRARCFHCGLTLRDWDDEDVPLDVHTTYAPTCEFAKERMRKQHQQGSNKTYLSNSDRESNLESSTKEKQCNGTGKEKSSDDEEIEIRDTGAVGGQSVVGNETSGSHGNSTRYSPMIEAVHEFGFSIDGILKAIEDEKKRSGKDFVNAEVLLNVLLDGEQ